jgi:hypothetical protein
MLADLKCFLIRSGQKHKKGGSDKSDASNSTCYVVTHLNLVSLLQYLLHVRDPVVADLADMQQPVDAPNIDERSVRLHSLDDTHNNVPNPEGSHLRLGGGLPVAHHEPQVLLIHLQELKGELDADELLPGDVLREK